jgi:hypothetical protein
LPADARARHLSASGPIVVARALFGGPDLEAAEAARLVATLSARTARASSAAAIAASASPAAAAAPVIAVAAAALGRHHAVDRIVKLAPRDRSVRALLALEHAHQAHLVEPIANNIERFDHARGPVGLDAQSARDRVGDRIGLGLGGDLTAALTAAFARRSLCGRCRNLDGRHRSFGLAARSDLSTLGSLGRCITGGLRGFVGSVHRIVELRGGCTHVRATCRGACSRRLAQGKRRELGEHLHGRLATPKPPEMPGLRGRVCGPHATASLLVGCARGTSPRENG